MGAGKELCRFAGNTTPAAVAAAGIAANVTVSPNVFCRVPASRVVQSKDGF
jgi:hypothetical protein